MSQHVHVQHVRALPSGSPTLKAAIIKLTSVWSKCLLREQSTVYMLRFTVDILSSLFGFSSLMSSGHALQPSASPPPPERLALGAMMRHQTGWACQAALAQTTCWRPCVVALHWFVVWHVCHWLYPYLRFLNCSKYILGTVMAMNGIHCIYRNIVPWVIQNPCLDWRVLVVSSLNDNGGLDLPEFIICIMTGCHHRTKASQLQLFKPFMQHILPLLGRWRGNILTGKHIHSFRYIFWQK